MQIFHSGCEDYKVDVTPGFGWVIRVITDDDLAEEDSSKHANGKLSDMYPLHMHFVVKFQGPLAPIPKKKCAHTHHVLVAANNESAMLISPDGKASKISLRQDTASQSTMHGMMHGMSNILNRITTMKPTLYSQ